MPGWNEHYARERSSLDYPDENLVRLLKKTYPADPGGYLLDLGCGSGRHLTLLRELGYEKIIGCDASANALALSSAKGDFNLVQAQNMALPFADSTVTAVIAWGSLHYSSKGETALMFGEIERILKPGGYIFGTLRSEFDTLMRSGTQKMNNEWTTDLKDISGSTVSFFSGDELVRLLKNFHSSSCGLIERTLLGDITKRISHWIFQAQKR